MALRLMIVDDSSVVRTRIAGLLADPRLADMEICGLAGDGELGLRGHQPGQSDVEKIGHGLLPAREGCRQ